MWTRVGMDFDPKPFILSIQEDVDGYLMRHRGRLLSAIAVEFCSAKVDMKVEPPAGGMYFHPLILALEVSLPLTRFVRNVFGYYQVPPTQLAPGAW